MESEPYSIFASTQEILWLEENKFYHVYNRGNAGSTIFFLERNYEYFLCKYAEYNSLHIGRPWHQKQGSD